MNTFSQFNIKTSSKAFTGDKIKIANVLDKLITIHDYKIEPSKFAGKGDCLHLQICINNEMRVLFTGSVKLMEQIRLVPEDGFPFQVTIKHIHQSYQFE